jgi:Flp pilus assembly protein TadD
MSKVRLLFLCTAFSFVLTEVDLVAIQPVKAYSTSEISQAVDNSRPGADSSSFTQIQDLTGADSLYAKANAAMAAGDLAGALTLYQKAIVTDSRSADVHNDYATALASGGRWEDACAEYKKASTLKPGDELFHANYARALLKTGHRAEAEIELNAAYKINPKNKNVASALADMYVKKGDLPAASLTLKEALQFFPASPELHNRLSYVLAQESQQPGDEWILELALDHAKQAVKDDPKSVQALLNLGSVQLLKSDSPSAVETYRQAVLLTPDNADVYYLLSSALEKNGDNSGSLKALQKFVELGSPSDPRVKTARDKLSR